MQKKQRSRVTDGVTKIVTLIADDKFATRFGAYIRAGDQMIAPKITDVIYERRDKLDTNAQIQGLVEYLDKNLPPNELKYGQVFVIPYPTVIALPSPYYATRYYQDKDELLFSAIINAYANYGSQEKPALYGFSYLLIGTLSKAKSRKPNKNLELSVDYLNDVLTAYRLVQHDHNIKNTNLQKLPSLLDYFDITLKPNLEISSSKTLRTHYHDLMDIWAKRLPASKEDLDRFVTYCEKLPLSQEVRYLLNLMIDAINSFCLGDHEDTILNSDRFAELGLKLCFTKVPTLSNYNISDLRMLYQKRPPYKGLLNILAQEIGISDNQIIKDWSTHARDVRNKVVHGLKFNVITRNKAQKALKYNLEVVSLVVDNMANPDWSIELLALGAETYKQLFET